MVPETDLHRVLRWAGARVPPEHVDKVRLEVDTSPTSITILECRPPWDRPDSTVDWTRFPIARLRYTKSTARWSLYWRDRNLKFHRYDRLPESPSIEDLLSEIDDDPTAIFWG